MRRRELSPDFWSDEKIWDLDDDAARLLLPGLYQMADREGRLLDRPFDIGAKVRPWAPREAGPLLDKLVSAGLVLRYSVGDLKLLCLPPDAWKKHQRPHPQEMASKLPAPGAAPVTEKPKREKKAKQPSLDLPGVPETEEARVESAQQVTWRYLDRIRTEHCEKLGIKPGKQKTPPPAVVNKKLLEAVEALGFVDRIIDGEIFSRFERLYSVFDFYVLNDFGRISPEGTLRDPPWPIELFLSPGVLKRAADDERAADAGEATA